MKITNPSIVIPVGVTLVLALSSAPSWGAADQVGEMLKEQTKARQEDKAKAVERQEQLENLKRDHESQRAQQQLDQQKIQRSDTAGPQPSKTGQTQLQLDQNRNDQQLQRLQTDQQINRIQRETDPLRQQQQIENLQRQQRIDSLQDQIRRNQTQQDLDRSRPQPALPPLR
jgi:hypothetical protein